MNARLLVYVLVPFCAGFCVGVWRAPRAAAACGRARASRITASIAGSIAAVLTALILLAKLFDSNTLGWMFGLGLMLVFAAMPCVALFCIGWLIGGSLRRRRTTEPSVADDGVDAATFAIAIDRGSVHAGDDDGHVVVRTVRPDLRLSLLLKQLRDDRYLPSIRGGQATWVIESSGNGRKAIAVMAEEWDAPRLVVPDESVARHFAGVRPALYFDYRAQVDPAAVLSTLEASPTRAFARAKPREQ